MAVNWDDFKPIEEPESGEVDWSGFKPVAREPKQAGIIGSQAAPEGEDTLGQAVGKEIVNTPERWQKILGGNLMLSGDYKQDFYSAVKPIVDKMDKGEEPSLTDQLYTSLQLYQSLPRLIANSTAPDDSPWGKARDWMAETGRELVDDAQKELDENRVNTSDPVVQFASDVARGAVDMGPALTAGFLTRNPQAATSFNPAFMGVFGTQIAGQSYADRIQQGLSEGDAAHAVRYQLAAEVIPEQIPVMALLKKGSPFLKRWFDATVGEGFQEGFTAIMEQKYDKMQLENMSLKEAMLSMDWKEVGYNALVGAGVGGTLAVPAQVADTISREPQYDQNKDEFIPTHVVADGQQAQQVTRRGKAVPDTYMTKDGKTYRDPYATDYVPSPDDGSLNADESMENIKAEVFGGELSPYNPQRIIEETEQARALGIINQARLSLSPYNPQRIVDEQVAEATPDIAPAITPITQPAAAEAAPVAEKPQPTEKELALKAKQRPKIEEESRVTWDRNGKPIQAVVEKGPDFEGMVDVRVTESSDRAVKPGDTFRQRADGLTVVPEAEPEIVGIEEDGAPIYKQPELTEEEQAQQEAAEVASAQIIEQAAAEPATATVNDLPEPTEAQKEAGNYKKGHVKVQGMDIAIENPAGSKRRPTWPAMKHHYGYIKRTVGADSAPGAAPHEVEQVDVFLNPDKDIAQDAPIFIVDQYDPKTDKFDEHKVMMGFDSEQEAMDAYKSNYTKGWKGGKFISEARPEQFKTWLEYGDEKAPFSEEADVVAEKPEKPEVAEEVAEKPEEPKQPEPKAEPTEVTRGTIEEPVEEAPVTTEETTEEPPSYEAYDFDITYPIYDKEGNEYMMTENAAKALRDVDTRIKSIKEVLRKCA